MMFQYRHGRSWFHRLDPVSKFIWLACVSVLCFRFGTAAWQALLLFTVLALGVWAAGLPPRSLWRGIRIPFWFGVPYFFMQLLFLPGVTEFAAFGPVTITAEALDDAAAVSLRLLTLVLASLLFIATTDPRDAVLAMAQKLRVPYRFAFAVSIALRFLPILEAEAAVVRAAQRLRGAASADAANAVPRLRLARQRWAARRSFAFAIFAGAVRRMQRMAETMDSRGFGLHGQRTYRRQLTTPRSGVGLTVASLFLMIVGLILY